MKTHVAPDPGHEARCPRLGPGVIVAFRAGLVAADRYRLGPPAAWARRPAGPCPGSVRGAEVAQQRLAEVPHRRDLLGGQLVEQMGAHALDVDRCCPSSAVKPSPVRTAS